MAENNDKGDLLKVTIDGTELSVPRGTTILEAAERVGNVIPRYCYHPGLSAPALCRMCLVEVEGAPKLLPSCVQQVQDGMVVRTESADARKARRSVIEFLLVNHPLDCPICDAAGQCELQDYAFETGQLRTRVTDPKMVLGRDNVTPEIVYFADRCILCTRCVRFMTEVAQEPVLQVMQRGHKGYIDTMDGELFEHPFSMNIVDVCPVGALVNEDVLLKPRAWDLDQTASICPGCSQGCNIALGTKENHIRRAKPRPNAEVNSFWMCDHGRKLVVNWGEGQRLEVPMIREGDDLVAVDWARALEALGDALGVAAGSARAVVSAGASNEDLFVLRVLMEAGGFDAGFFAVPQGDEHALAGFPKLALRSDRAPNAAGAEAIGYARVDDPYRELGGHTGPLFVLHDDLGGAEEGFGADASLYVHIGPWLPPQARERADIVFPATTFAEMDGSFVNFEGRVQRFSRALHPPGLARPFWMSGSAVLVRLGQRGGYRQAAAAFEALASAHSAFAGLSYDSIGLRGALLASGSPEAAAPKG